MKAYHLWAHDVAHAKGLYSRRDPPPPPQKNTEAQKRNGPHC